MKNIFLLVSIGLVAMGTITCTYKNSRMMEEEKINTGSVLKNNRIYTEDGSISFAIPESWVKWYHDNKAYPNLHLSAKELSSVKLAEGEWDKEFATYLNFLLPYEHCFAHVGSEGWGALGLSYADLQVRAYSFPKDLPDLKRDRLINKLKALPDLIRGISPSHRIEKTGGWKQVFISYRGVFVDYSAIAFIDIRMKKLDGRVLAFAFMYTSHSDHSPEIKSILNSVTIDNSS